MTDNSNSSNMEQIQKLANQLHGKRRKEFWKIYHNSGEVVAKEFFDDVIDENLQDQLKSSMVENTIF